MVTAVDTNVLVDVATEGSEFWFDSIAALRMAGVAGAVVICDVVYAELCVLVARREPCDSFLDSLGINVEHLHLESSFRASRNWISYLESGGKKNRILPDFLIAGHAAYRANQLLTRDAGFLRSHFPDLKVVHP